MHTDDGNTPSPLVLLPQQAGDEEVDGEGHIEAENVGLELLRHGLAASIVFTKLGAVDWDHGVDAPDPKAHDDSTKVHDGQRSLAVAQTRDEHDKITQRSGEETAEE